MIDINKAADLANIKLTLEEKKTLGVQLKDIIKFVSHLEKVSIDEGTADDSPKDLKNVFSEDINTPSFTSEEALSNTTNIYNDHFKVDIVLKNKGL